MDVQRKSGYKAFTMLRKNNQMTRDTFLMIGNLVKDMTAAEVLEKME